MELIITTYNTLLSCKDGCFEISQGGKKQKVSAQDVSVIQVSRGVQITTDAIMFAISNEIPILFIERSGKPIGRVWSPKYGSISTIRKGQLLFSQSAFAAQWIKQQLAQKISNQQAMLLMLPAQKSQKTNAKAVARLEDYRNKIKELEGNDLREVASDLRGWEGNASRIYFQELNRFLPEQYRFDVRSQHPAHDIANAFLNYGYGILYGLIEGALIKAGIDPYIGILHRDEYNRPVLVYDVIERYRIWVDYVVFNLLSQLEVDESYYTVDDKGAYWLENLGRRVIVQSINDYLDEVIGDNDPPATRLTQVQLYANDLAKTFSSIYTKSQH